MTSKGAEEHAKHNTLACVVSLCLGKVTTIELRNEAFITGRVIDVDGFMNVTLREATFVDPMRNSAKFEFFFVQNRLVRFVQIPAEIDMKLELQRMFDPAFKGKGRRKDSSVQLSGGRKKIMQLRYKRRQEDLENAMKMKLELAQKSEKPL